MSVKIVFFSLYVLHTAVNMADGSRHIMRKQGPTSWLFFKTLHFFHVR